MHLLKQLLPALMVAVSLACGATCGAKCGANCGAKCGAKWEPKPPAPPSQFDGCQFDDKTSKAVELSGYVVDTLCYKNFLVKQEAYNGAPGISPDKVYLRDSMPQHTRACLLVDYCAKTGYTLVHKVKDYNNKLGTLEAGVGAKAMFEFLASARGGPKPGVSVTFQPKTTGRDIVLVGCGATTCGATCGAKTCGATCGAKTCGATTCGATCGATTCGATCGAKTCGATCGAKTCGATTCGAKTCGATCGAKTCGATCGATTCGATCGAKTCGATCGAKTCGATCGATTCGATCGAKCGAKCGADCGACGSKLPKWTPAYTKTEYTIPASPKINPNGPKQLGEETFGVAVNGVPFESHAMTLTFDNCLGHTSNDHQYHYHLAPKCLLETLYGADFSFPANAGKYWSKSCTGDGCTFPAKGAPSPVVGFALDGFPIFALYDREGALQTGAGLDACNGKKDTQGNYAYYITTKAPYFPPCLMGVVGKVTTEVSTTPCKPPPSQPKTCTKVGSTWVHARTNRPCSLSDSTPPTTKKPTPKASTSIYMTSHAHVTGWSSAIIILAIAAALRI